LIGDSHCRTGRNTWAKRLIDLSGDIDRTQHGDTYEIFNNSIGR
jgi:hypothetical protein